VSAKPTEKPTPPPSAEQPGALPYGRASAPAKQPKVYLCGCTDTKICPEHEVKQ
jgi:hypothetical protein